MAAKVKAKSSSRAVAPSGVGMAQTGFSTTHPLTMEERLHRIDAMHKRMDGYIQYMCGIASLTGVSTEVKERAVAVFYEQMLVVERQLGHIHDEFRLE